MTLKERVQPAIKESVFRSDNRPGRMNARVSIPCIFAALLGLVSACSGSGSELDAKYEDALQSYSRHEVGESLRLLKEIYEEDPSYPNVALMFAKLQYFQQNYDQAEEILRRAVASDGSVNASLWLAKVLQTREAGREEALEIVNEIVEGDSGNPEAWYLKGRLHEELDQTPEALAAYRYVIAEGRKIALAHLQLAAHYGRAGLHEQARRHLNLAALLADGDPAIMRAIDSFRAENDVPIEALDEPIPTE